MENNLKKAIKGFVENGDKILELWDNNMDSLEGYPFKKDFGEVMVDVTNWLDNYSNVDESIEYKELKELSNIYEAITSKFESYHDTKNVVYLTEIRDLETLFDEYIKDLKFAKHKRGNIFTATKSERSVNTIIVDGEPITYYYFFKDYVPYTV